MKKLFADTGYWIARIDPKDVNHQRSLEFSQQQGAFHIFTSELVLIEVLTFFSGRTPYLRQAAFQAVARIRQNPQVTVVSQTRYLFESLLLLYGTTLDKNWSPTDCASFEIMKSKKITEALAYDKHFEQAGFVALLRGAGQF